MVALKLPEREGTSVELCTRENKACLQNRNDSVEL